MEKRTIGPQPGRQTQFLSTPADIAIYGGSAGGGKTYALLLEPLRHIYNPGFGAVFFRRTYPQVTLEGGMWPESQGLYPLLGARSNEVDLEWRFPSKARVKFAHMQLEKNRLDWQGAQIPLICWDQLEHFTAEQFFYMLSRNRSICGVRPYIRATCNPDPDSFLASFLSWWIAEDGYADLDKAGRLRWMVRRGDDILWFDQKPTDEASKSVTFIPASIYDNPILLQSDPDYLANLKSLSLVDRERLLGDEKRGGNWHIRPAAGKVFNRGWFEIVEAVPDGGEIVAFWDFAATERKMAGDPDYTARTLMLRVGNLYFVLDSIAERWGPAEAERIFVNITRQDAQRAGKVPFRVRWEIEPGAAAKKENVRLIQVLAGLDAKGIPSRGDKVTRAKPLAVQCEAGNVKLLRGSWNETWLNHMHAFPDGAHDDICDASSGAFTDLATGRRVALSRQG